MTFASSSEIPSTDFKSNLLALDTAFAEPNLDNNDFFLTEPIPSISSKGEIYASLALFNLCPPMANL